MDTIGPITKDVTDCAIVLNAIAGNDTYDPTSVDIKSSDYLQALKTDLEGAKIGLPKEFLGDMLDKDVKEAILNAVKTYESLGCHCEEISIPHAEYAVGLLCYSFCRS